MSCSTACRRTTVPLFAILTRRGPGASHADTILRAVRHKIGVCASSSGPVQVQNPRAPRLSSPHLLACLFQVCLTATAHVTQTTHSAPPCPAGRACASAGRPSAAAAASLAAAAGEKSSSGISAMEVAMNSWMGGSHPSPSSVASQASTILQATLTAVRQAGWAPTRSRRGRDTPSLAGGQGNAWRRPYMLASASCCASGLPLQLACARRPRWSRARPGRARWRC